MPVGNGPVWRPIGVGVRLHAGAPAREPLATNVQILGDAIGIKALLVHFHQDSPSRRRWAAARRKRGGQIVRPLTYAGLALHWPISRFSLSCTMPEVWPI